MSKYDALAERLVGGMLGWGRQHKPFPYSSPDLSEEEKAQERAAHYRQLHRGVRLQHIKARKGKEGEKEEVGKKTFTHNKRLVVMEVIPDEPYKKLVDARGLKEPKKTLPKADSVRKPYVGKVMKEKLFEALKLDPDSKEGKRVLRTASQLYKAGGRSWEDILSTLGA